MRPTNVAPTFPLVKVPHAQVAQQPRDDELDHSPRVFEKFPNCVDPLTRLKTFAFLFDFARLIKTGENMQKIMSLDGSAVFVLHPAGRSAPA